MGGVRQCAEATPSLPGPRGGPRVGVRIGRSRAPAGVSQQGQPRSHEALNRNPPLTEPSHARSRALGTRACKTPGGTRPRERLGAGAERFGGRAEGRLALSTTVDNFDPREKKSSSEGGAPGGACTPGLSRRSSEPRGGRGRGGWGGPRASSRTRETGWRATRGPAARLRASAAWYYWRSWLLCFSWFVPMPLRASRSPALMLLKLWGMIGPVG